MGHFSTSAYQRSRLPLPLVPNDTLPIEVMTGSSRVSTVLYGNPPLGESGHPEGPRSCAIEGGEQVYLGHFQGYLGT